MSYIKDIRLHLLLIFIIGLAQYANTYNHDYAWDDAIVLTENSRVQKGLSNVPELFENIKSQKTENKYGYRPITLLTFATEVEFFGLNPTVGHIGNIILYALLCALVLFFLNRIFPDDPWRNLLIALLFTVHPLHTEVVANIKSRDEILAMLFGITGLLFFARGLHSKPFLFYTLSCLAMVFSFLSKENAVTFCLAAGLLPWFVKPSATLIKKLLPAISAVAILGVLIGIRKYVYSMGFFQTDVYVLADKGIFLQEGFVGNPLFGVSDMMERAANIFHLIFLYLQKFFYPAPLLHDYSYNYLLLIDWSHPVAWLSLAVTLALLFIGLWGMLKGKMYGFGIMFFFATISIYLHVIQLAPDLFAERFMFVPSLGLSIALVSALFSIKKLRVPSGVVVGAACIVFFTLTWKRNYAWKDNETLFRTDLPELKNCVRTNYNYALLLHGKYYDAPEAEKPSIQKDILRHYERALELSDKMFNVYMDLGGAYMEFGYPKKALEVFERSTIRYGDLSVPYVQLGKYYMSFKNYEKAVPYFETAIEKGDKNSDFYYLLAISLFNTGQQQKAIDVMIKGEALGTSSSAYHSLMARLYRKLGDNENAIAALKRGLAIYPNDKGLQADFDHLLFQ
ncbi:MAG: tetratricopeptide repeat protein [Flavobacteriales bacterium]|nr:tetratricopeptide repeat protein [Flavobacteriales bacterium]